MLKKIEHYLLQHINKIMFIWGIGIVSAIIFISKWCMDMDCIVINEVCSNNFSVLKDEYSNYPDYIEIYNPSNMPIPLEGMGLSDSRELKKYEFENIWIGPKSYHIIYADEKSGDQCAEFSLDRNGETVYLFSRSGKLIDYVEIPQLEYNTSYARINDNDEEWQRRTATPGMSNSESAKVVDPTIETVKFSMEGGFFEEEFYLSLEGTEKGIIYYTLDGSEPSLKSICYTEPILITEVSQNENVLSARDDLTPRSISIPDFKVDKAMVVRASVYDVDKQSFGKSIAHTYFIGYEKKEEYSNFPIISMVTDPQNLFDYEYGIYGNGVRYQKYLDNGGLKDGEIVEYFEHEDGGVEYLYTASNAFNNGREWEREAQIEYFDKEHKNRNRQSIGIRIAGNSTNTWAHKAFNFFARDIYDENITMTFNWNGEENSWKTVKMRNGGNECNTSKIKEPFMHSLVKERNVSIQDAAPYILFINGEYWGIYSMRERYNEEYVEKHYGVEKRDVWLIDAKKSENRKALKEYEYLINYLEKTDFTVTENYRKLCELIDIQSFIDFYCINIYLGNTDVFLGKNNAIWRSAEIKNEEYYDGKWRWMLYDLDLTCEKYNENSFNEEVNRLMKEASFKNIIRNDEFRERFYNSFLEIANICFDEQDVNLQLNEWVSCYKDQVLKSHRQFVDVNYTEETYQAHIDKIKEFFKKRPEYIFDYMDEYMKLYE